MCQVEQYLVEYILRVFWISGIRQGSVLSPLLFAI